MTESFFVWLFYPPTTWLPNKLPSPPPLPEKKDHFLGISAGSLHRRCSCCRKVAVPPGSVATSPGLVPAVPLTSSIDSLGSCSLTPLPLVFQRVSLTPFSPLFQRGPSTPLSSVFQRESLMPLLSDVVSMPAAAPSEVSLTAAASPKVSSPDSSPTSSPGLSLSSCSIPSYSLQK